MTALILIAIDLVAMAALVFGLYFPRHRRADLVAAFLGVNVGVLAVTIILANSTVSAGLGLGLFGVLSIIRLRSDQISQTEIAYYFASLALGLLTGMSSAVTPLLGGLRRLEADFRPLHLADRPAGPRNRGPRRAEGGPRAAPRRVRRLGQRRQARPRERPDARRRSLEGRLTRRPAPGFAPGPDSRLGLTAQPPNHTTGHDS